MEGESMQNGKPVQVRSVSRQVAEDTVDWSMEVSQDGQTWFETMKMTYSRVD
jgi:hypothetical protein